MYAQHPRDQLELIVVHPHGRRRRRLFGRGLPKRRLTVTHASHHRRWNCGGAMTSWQSGHSVALQKPS
jgi:hypothetical protein